ncbi:MAG: hypothetical protein ACTSVV_11410 [Promethearchaeota archaeon]
MINFKDIIFVHYGSTEFNIYQFDPVKNREDGWYKPIGGLWASPLNSEFGWKDWCKAEMSKRECNPYNAFYFKLKENAKVYIIDSFKDAMNCILMKGINNKLHIDYEAMSRKYDAIFLTVKGEKETRFSKPLSLYGWDCESILIMNPDCIAILDNVFDSLELLTLK